MDDVKSQAKKAVLDEIMKLMDGAMGEGLKKKSPKFMSVEVEAEAEPVVDGEESEESDSMKADAMDAMKSAAPEMPEMDEDMSDDDKMRLKELYEKYC